MIYDLAIIGAGIAGTSIARSLAQFSLKICLIEKENDVSCGCSKANSGIIHAGYDPEPGSLMAALNVRGNELFPLLARDLQFDYRKTGSLVIAFTESETAQLKKLKKRGETNGLKNLRIIDQAELRKIEPHIGEEALCALYAPSAGIISPYQATWAIAENAVQNGVELLLENEVRSILKENGIFTIKTGRSTVQAKYAINAAGLYADEISRMAGAREYRIVPRHGEYCLFDNKCSYLANHVLFQTPNAMGKGVLVTPTVDGNILVGPSAGDGEDKQFTGTSRCGQDFILEAGEKTIPGLPGRNIINSFAGIRALAYNSNGSAVHDFIIEEDKTVKGFINVGGICSPGLTAAPAIGEYVCDLLQNAGLVLEKKDGFIPVRKGLENFHRASLERKSRLIEENSLYGRIICRCEMITEAEIVQAIRSTVGAADVDGVKRRTRAGMGRCQGGFCSPRVTEIISRERGIPLINVTKSGGCSYVLHGKTRINHS